MKDTRYTHCMPTRSVSSTSELIDEVAAADPGDEIVASGGEYEMDSRWTVTNGGTESPTRL